MSKSLEPNAGLVRSGEDGHPITTSMIVAEGTGSQHSSVIRLVRDNVCDFEEFGRVGFEIEPFETAGGTQSRKVAVLNREHAMLLMTYMRNNDVVRQFKKNLIHAFTDMERRLAAGQKVDVSQLTRMELLQIAMNAEEERLALEAENKALEPKAEAYDRFMDAEGMYGVGTVGKMLGIGRTTMFRKLRNHGVLISKGDMRNTPYQKYMHHFVVKSSTYIQPDGSESVQHTTYVQPSGVDFIRRKLGLLTIDPLPPASVQGQLPGLL